MRISLNWLNDYVDIKNENPKYLAEKITRSGVNVEGIKSFNIPNLVVGYVEERADHPDSDHLNVCMVNLGSLTTQIVCGAPNVNKGQKVIVATVGAILPGDFEIKKATIRGVESNGMICALYELGLEDKETNYYKGIHVLGDDAVVGSNPLEYLGLDDTIYELDLNPNRNDCLSHLGFAYETAAVLNKSVIMPRTNTNDINESINDYFSLDVQTENCSMYKARMVKNVVIGESPDFIKKRLTSAGMRPINNVVDISNYIMLEYGQPLHFFDKDKLGNKIIVRMAHDQEQTITLDNKVRDLIKDDIVIANDKEIVAIAGVMGCANSEITEDTKNILIESAIFNPYNVRYTSIRLDLRSEASLRFEKVLNYEYTEEALNRACYLLEKYASGGVLKDTISHDKVNKNKKIASISKERINAILGIELTNQDIEKTLNRLDFRFDVKDEIYTVEIPNRRMDVSIKEDLIEEIGRLYGFDNIVGKLPVEPLKIGGYHDKTSFRKQISKRMRMLGLNETRTYTLISDSESKLFNNNEDSNISLQLPISSDKTIIRQSIIPSLLKVVDYNVARNVKDINIYEISNIYYKKDDYIEETKLAIAMFSNTFGKYIGNTWQGNNIVDDFYVIKGLLENTLNYLGLNDRYRFIKGNTPKELHPGMSAEIVVDNISIGYIGRIHPSINKLPIFVGEINLDRLYNLKTRPLKYREIPKFPSISKDIAFIIDEYLEATEVIKVIRNAAGKLLSDIDVFDVYSGDKVGNNKKSILFHLTFIDQNKTLTDSEVNALLDNIIKEVETKLKGILRNK